MLPALFNPHAGPYLLKEELLILLVGASPLPGGAPGSRTHAAQTSPACKMIPEETEHQEEIT